MSGNEPTPESSEGPRHLSDAEIAALASTMPVSDPTKTPGNMTSMSKIDILALLKLMGVDKLDPRSPELTLEIARSKFCRALWDVQRLDYAFHGKFYGGREKLNPDSLPSWPGWKEKHVVPGLSPETRRPGMQMQLDGIRDADKMDTYVLRHFMMSSFTQAEVMKGINMNPPAGLSGAWVGAKKAMGSLAEDLTLEGGDKVPFFTYSYTAGPEKAPTKVNLLIAEILEVKQAAWPEPSPNEWKWIRSSQQTKFGWEANGPLVPMMRTPAMPVILVRYAYSEGRPKDGLQFTLYLQEKFEKAGMSPAAARKKLEYGLQTAVPFPEVHIRTLARVLDANSSFLDPSYVEELQSHWKGISREVEKETKISFITPCMRLRWRALEELETGTRPTKDTTCANCGKTGNKMMCSKCKSVYYCSADCNKKHWSAHKENCMFHKKLLQPNPDLPQDKFYVTVRTFHDTILDKGFAIEQEAIKQSGGAMPGDCPPNEYGSERFVVLVQMPPDYAVGDGLHKGKTMFIWDRRRSVFARTGPGDVQFAKEREGTQLPFDARGHAKIADVIRTRGVQKQIVYVYAKRIGDCLELDLNEFVDFPGWL